MHCATGPKYIKQRLDFLFWDKIQSEQGPEPNSRKASMLLIGKEMSLVKKSFIMLMRITFRPLKPFLHKTKTAPYLLKIVGKIVIILYKITKPQAIQTFKYY